jgi:hypothetical protein
MTREEFTGILDEKGIKWSLQGGKIIVTDQGEVDLQTVYSLPPNIEFGNGTYVYLDSLEELPPGVTFKNGGSVSLHSLKSIHPETRFENGRGIWLDSLGMDTTDIIFTHTPVLAIRGIGPNKILNAMISAGIFDKKKR